MVKKDVSAGVVIAPLAVVMASFAIWRTNVLAAEERVLDACSTGRSLEDCSWVAGEPTRRYYDPERKLRGMMWKSGEDFPGMADIFIVSKDDVIVEVINLDREGGRARFQKAYSYMHLEDTQ